MGKLFFFGDSITAGAWDERGGWCNRVIGSIMAQVLKGNDFYCMPYNLGVSGDTAPDILIRMEEEVKNRCYLDDPYEPVEIVFALGINDSCWQVNENQPRFTDEEFSKNIGALIDNAQKLAGRVSFIGLNAIDEKLVNPIPWAPDKAYLSERVKKFEDIIAKICAAKNLSFLPQFDLWNARADVRDLLIDGVHPNSKGHAFLAEQMETFLINDDFVAFHKG